MAQEAPAGNESVLDVVLAADKERTALMAEAETATDPDRIGEIYMRLADIDAHIGRGAGLVHPQGPGLRAGPAECADA